MRYGFYLPTRGPTATRDGILALACEGERLGPRPLNSAPACCWCSSATQSRPPGSQWLYFADQWDPKSPWHDERVRRAANLAMDRKGINQALTLGRSHLTNSIIPESFEFYWQPPLPVYDPAKAKELLAEAGHPNGFDAGEFFCDSSYSNVAEALRPVSEGASQAQAAKAGTDLPSLLSAKPMVLTRSATDYPSLRAASVV